MNIARNIAISGLLLAVLVNNQFKVSCAGQTNSAEVAKLTAKWLASLAFPGADKLLEAVLQIAIIGVDIHFQDDGSEQRHEDVMKKIDTRTDELKQLILQESGKVINKITFDNARRSIVQNTLQKLDEFKRSYKEDFIRCIIKHNCDAETRKKFRDNWLQPRSADRVALSNLINSYVIRNGSHDSDLRVFDVIRQAHYIAVADYADCDLSESIRGSIDKMHDFISGVVIQVYQSILYMYMDKYNELKNTNLTDAGNVLSAAEDFARKFKDDIKSIAAARRIALDGMPNEIRRCQQANQIRGVTYDRLTRFIQSLIVQHIKVINQGNGVFTMKNQERSDSPNVCKWNLPFDCETHLPLYNCSYIYEHMTNMYLEPDDSMSGERIYHHYYGFGGKNEVQLHGKFIGDYKTYSNPDALEYVADIRKYGYSTGKAAHQYDQCWVDRTNDPKSVRKFSTAPVKASAGYVVTGVRFHIVDATIFLQIHEGKLVNGSVDPTTTKWKKDKVDDPRVVKLDINHRKFILDDFKVPNGCLLTGVAFEFMEKYGTIKLNAYNQKVDEYGNLLGTPHQSHGHEESIDHEHGKNRLEITLEQPEGSEIAPKTSRHLVMNTTGGSYFIKFQPTDLEKDAGQTTVPYLDIQDVVTNPPVPLKGFGAYYSGLKNFGGYIGLRIFTADDLNALSDAKINHSFQPLLDGLKKVKTNHGSLKKKA